MKRLDELLSLDDDAWPLLLGWRSDATHPVDIVACAPEAGRATLLALQITTRSPMGALALRSGGLLIDHGWLRVLAAPSERIGGGLCEWNASLGGPPLEPPLDEALVIAYDAIGGFFALDGPRSGAQAELRYLAPDTTGWDATGLGYSGFLVWAMGHGLERFYADMRWPGWASEVEALGPDAALSISPPLGLGTTPISERSRRAVPARELWALQHDLGRQLADVPDGTRVVLDLD